MPFSKIVALSVEKQNSVPLLLSGSNMHSAVYIFVGTNVSHYICFWGGRVEKNQVTSQHCYFGTVPKFLQKFPCHNIHIPLIISFQLEILWSGIHPEYI